MSPHIISTSHGCPAAGVAECGISLVSWHRLAWLHFLLVIPLLTCSKSMQVVGRLIPQLSLWLAPSMSSLLAWGSAGYCARHRFQLVQQEAQSQTDGTTSMLPADDSMHSAAIMVQQAQGLNDIMYCLRIILMDCLWFEDIYSDGGGGHGSIFKFAWVDNSTLTCLGGLISQGGAEAAATVENSLSIHIHVTLPRGCWDPVGSL
jgi:hypothetical protein